MNYVFKSALTLLGTFGMASVLHADPITIMPLGDSITLGVNSTYGSGYRDPLYQSLTASNISFKFIGSTTAGSTQTLINAGDGYDNGYGHYQIGDIDQNLKGSYQPVAADSNAGGNWLTGANADPNIILLMIGTNDFLQQNYATSTRTLPRLSRIFITTVPPPRF